MECQICNLRSAEGFCHICNRMICAECGHVCQSCGKMACIDHVSRSRSGKWRCDTCRDQRRARRAAADGVAAPDLTTAPATAALPPEEELVFEAEPPPAGRLEVDPWKASLWVGAVAIGATLSFAAISGDIPWPLLLVAVLGAGWALIGIIGPHAKKGLAVLGLALNIIPLVIAAVIGITGLGGEVSREAPIEHMDPEQRFEERQRKQRQFLDLLRSSRSGAASRAVPAPPRPAADSPEQQ